MSVAADVVDLVLDRCQGLCEVCSSSLGGERGYGWSVHHRRFRDGRTDSDTAPNLLVVCGGSNVDRCHGVIHGDKTYAMEVGWAISRHETRAPRTVPVLVDNYSRWTYLAADGTYSDDPPEAP